MERGLSGQLHKAIDHPLGSSRLERDLELVALLRGEGLAHRVLNLTQPPSSLRGGEADEAIQSVANRSGLLRYARNDEL